LYGKGSEGWVSVIIDVAVADYSLILGVIILLGKWLQMRRPLSRGTGQDEENSIEGEGDRDRAELLPGGEEDVEPAPSDNSTKEDGTTDSGTLRESS